MACCRWSVELSCAGLHRPAPHNNILRLATWLSGFLAKWPSRSSLGRLGLALRLETLVVLGGGPEVPTKKSPRPLVLIELLGTYRLLQPWPPGPLPQLVGH